MFYHYVDDMLATDAKSASKASSIYNESRRVFGTYTLPGSTLQHVERGTPIILLYIYCRTNPCDLCSTLTTVWLTGIVR